MLTNWRWNNLKNGTSHLAENLLLDYYFYHDRQISAVDMFFRDRKHFSDLVLQGLITKKEKRLMKKPSETLQMNIGI